MASSFTWTIAYYVAIVAMLASAWTLIVTVVGLVVANVINTSKRFSEDVEPYKR